MIRTLVKGLLLLLLTVVALAAAGWAWLWHTESGAQWAWAQAGAAVSETRDASLDAHLTGTLGSGIDFRDLVYRDENLEVTAARARLAVTFRSSPMALIVRRLDIGDVVLDIAVKEDEAEPQAPDWPENLALPFPLIARSLAIDGGIIRRGEVEFPIDAIQASGRWHENLDLEIASASAPDLSGALSLNARLTSPYALRSEIRVTRYDLPDEVLTDVPWMPKTMTADINVDGDLNTLGLSGRLLWPDFIPEAAFEGEIRQPTSGAAWALEAEVATVAVPLVPDALAPVTLGGLRLSASGQQLSLDFEGEGNLDSPLTRDATVRMGGSLDDGSLQHWMVEGSARLQDGSNEGAKTPNWPNAPINFDARGSREEWAVDLAAPDIFGGSLSVTAQAPLAEAAPLRGELTATKIALKPLLEMLAPYLQLDDDSQLPGVADVLQTDTIDAHILSSVQPEPLIVDTEIRELAGKVRGRAVKASGRLAYGEDRLEATGLRLVSGDSEAVIDGPLYGPPGLSIALDIEDLADFLPEATGSLAGTVRYRHDPDRGMAGSHIRADLEGKDLGAFEWKAGAVRISQPEQAAPDVPIAISVLATGLENGNFGIDDLSLSVVGDIERQVLDLEARLQEGTLAARLAGGTPGDAAPGWSGVLEELS
ncbi:MAG: hypothetical protein R3212_04955, partial [Xanthomonadales bacterium]|nr:hypothetical protein [Xanthomonadales bacterium]